MTQHIHYKGLYDLVLLSSLAIFVIALGGGLFGQDGVWFNHWQHNAFQDFCHQDPQRSYRINGVPMAVCSRCIGIYAGLAGTWMLFPLFIKPIEFFSTFYKKFLGAAVFLNIADIIGNLAGFWQNTLAFRFGFGFLIGLSIVLVLSGEFIKTSNTTTTGTGIRYGTDRTAQ